MPDLLTGSCLEPFEEVSDAVVDFVFGLHEVHSSVVAELIGESEEMVVISVGWCAYRAHVCTYPSWPSGTGVSRS